MAGKMSGVAPLVKSAQSETFFRVTPHKSNPPCQNRCMKTENLMQAQVTAPDDQLMAQSTPVNEVLPINNALQIQAAEYWLKLGEADLALKELDALPTRIWRCSWALETRIAAIGVLRGRDELKIQA